MEPELAEFEKNVKYVQSLNWNIKHLSTPEGKEANFQIKDVDLKKNQVAFYFSAFNNKDSDGDVIKPGAFTKTFSEQKDRIKHLYNHNTTQSPGKIISLGEDAHGAFAVSQIIMTSLGSDVLKQYEAGNITEHSMGFRAVKESYDQMEDANVITEIKLWEVSSLTAWGANMNTPMIGVKNLNSIKAKIVDLLSKSEITEDQYKLVESYIKSLTKPIQKTVVDYNELLKGLQF